VDARHVSSAMSSALVPATTCACGSLAARASPRGVSRRARSRPSRGTNRFSASAVSDTKELGAGWVSDELPDEVDVCIVGAGIGGLSCAALLGKYGVSVAVAEAHSVMGGAAHGFHRDGYEFDSGPSYFLGLSSPPGESINGLRQVLDAVGETLPRGAAVYNSLKMYFPDGNFECVADRECYRDAIRRFAGDDAVKEWDALEEAMTPLGDAAVAIPFAGMRADSGVVLTMAKYVAPLVKALGGGPKGAEGFEDAKWLRENFSALVDTHVRNEWLRRLLDLECFVISGLKADRTSAAIMAFTFAERHKEEGCVYDYPIGGSQSLIDALARGVRKHGGVVALRQPVERIVVEDGRAVGMKLKRCGRVIRARTCVVTNASAWDTVNALLPEDVRLKRRSSGDEKHTETTPLCDSFVHLHLGIDAAGLPPASELGIHHLVVDDWSKGVDGERNVFNISIPTTLDPSQAPEGKHTVHIYGAANEPYERWAATTRGSAEYEKMKREAADDLYRALEKVIPDIRKRVEVEMVATPLTQKRFVRRHEGTYGPGVDMTRANLYGASLAPGPATGVDGLWAVGDSTYPGIGVPAAAGSGFFTANSIVSVWKNLKMLYGPKIGKNV
jgi:phytoene dehydrogenase-like protein